MSELTQMIVCNISSLAISPLFGGGQKAPPAWQALPGVTLNQERSA